MKWDKCFYIPFQITYNFNVQEVDNAWIECSKIRLCINIKEKDKIWIQLLKKKMIHEFKCSGRRWYMNLNVQKEDYVWI